MKTAGFQATFDALARLGFNAVPAHPLEKHPAGPWKGLAAPDSRRVTNDDIQAGLWVLNTYPDEPLRAFLFPASHPVHPLVVVDVDDLRFLQRTVDLFGETEYLAETKRGVHLFYRATPDTKVTSRNWLFGERSVDVKAWNAGVMAYKPAIPLELWNLEDIPLFDTEAYERVWLEHRPKARAAARAAALRNPKAYVYVEHGEPNVTASGLEQMGDVAGDTMVTHERTGAVMRLDQVPPGDKVFAFDREDEHASGQVWEGAGQRWYTDHTFGALWRVVTGMELDWTRSFKREPDPQTLDGIPIHDLPTHGFLTIPEADGLTIIKAPHGTGKTYLARQWMDAADTGVSVCNTAALAEHNAARFGIDCYQEKETGPKVSTTINSLPKLDRKRVDFMHIDEADQVHGYLHSGTMDKPTDNMRAMLDLAATARRTLIASADLTDEDILWYVKAYAKRNPTGAVRVYRRAAETGARQIRLVPLSRAKSAFESAYRSFESGDYPIACGCTARRDVGNLAWGYAGRRSDLRCFWVSGENSRYAETIGRFRGQWSDRLTQSADFLDAADVFFFSPALQSGVSLESTTGKVFILHTKADFDVETIAQMLMRFRHVADPEVVWGVSAFGRRTMRLDDRYLEGICIGLADETDRLLADALPEYTAKRAPVDAEFAWSWRITQRRTRRSYADPVGRAREVIAGHGWTLVDETSRSPDEPDDDAKLFNRTRGVAADARDHAVAEVIANAGVLDEAGADAIDRAHVHHGDDRQRLERKRIADFYALAEVTVADVERDAKGKFRKRCRMYTWLLFRSLYGLEEFKALAFYDWQQSKGRQPSEYKHIFQKATLLLELWNHVTDGQHILHTQPVQRDTLSHRVMDFVGDRGPRWAELFRGAVPVDVAKAAAWVGHQLRRCGAAVHRVEGTVRFEFEEVHQWSGPFRTRVLEAYEKEKENEEWQKKLKKLRSMNTSSPTGDH